MALPVLIVFHCKLYERFHVGYCSVYPVLTCQPMELTFRVAIMN